MTDRLNLNFNYHNPVNIISSPGILKTIKKYLPAERTLLITDKIFTDKGVTADLKDIIGENNITVYDRVQPNPELDDIDNAVKQFRSESFTSVTALGGGSVIDFAKAVSVLLADKQNVYLDDLLRSGSGILPSEKLFLIAVPTTSGTGSEVTPFATVWDSATNKKHSLAGDIVFPSLAILDPLLTLEIPEEITLFTGLDAISHSLESLWNKNRSPVSEAFAIESLNLAVKSLPAVLSDPDSISSRSEMQWASTLGGLAISQTRTAIAHSISYPLTLKFGVPHGLACSFTLSGLIDHYNETVTGSQTRTLFDDIRGLLKSFDLHLKIQKYATPGQIQELSGEMYNPSRADNYINDIDDSFISKLLRNSLC